MHRDNQPRFSNMSSRSPGEPLKLTTWGSVHSKNHTASSSLSSLLVFMQPQHPSLVLFLWARKTVWFVARSEVCRFGEKQKRNSIGDLVWFHGRAEVTDKSSASCSAHANGGLECDKEMNRASEGSCFLVNCFELFLKENPSSQAVNICCGINGISQERAFPRACFDVLFEFAKEKVN